jgi:hypothetical protein
MYNDSIGGLARLLTSRIRTTLQNSVRARAPILCIRAESGSSKLGSARIQPYMGLIKEGNQVQKLENVLVDYFGCWLVMK